MTIKRNSSGIKWDALKQKDMLFLLVCCASIYVPPLAVLYFAVHYVRQLRIKDIQSPKGQLMYPYLLLGINALISSIYSLNLVSIGVTLGIVIPYLIYAVYAENMLQPDLCVRMLRFLVYISFPAALIAFSQRFFFPVRKDERVISTFANPNLYAFFLMAVILITLGLFLENPDKKEKRIYSVIMLANLGALYLTQTRTVLVVLAVSVFFLLLLNKRFKLAMALMALFGIGFLVLISNPQYMKLIPRLSVIDASLSSREDIWNIAWDAIRTNPFIGRGILSYKYYALQYGIEKTHAHNILLNTWVEWGLAGVGLLLWASMLIFKRGIWGLTHSPYRHYIAVLLSFMFGTFIYGIVDNPAVNIQTGILYLLLTSMVMVFTRDYPKPYSSRKKTAQSTNTPKPRG